MNDNTKGIVIAGASSGAGKTTIVTGIIGALVKRGLHVHPFKAGPDYIDPSYHTVVAQRPSRNLDTWMLPLEHVSELFHRACSDADIALVEGVMGLYDGHSESSETGSTAELAKILGLPVLLILDASGTSRSIGAMALGYKNFDPELNLAGIIFNGIGSERHYEMCRQAVIDATGLAVVGYLPKRNDLVLPERHLGLVPMAETPAAEEFFRQLTAQIEKTIDLDNLLAISGKAIQQKDVMKLFPQEKQPKQVRIAVAKDKAFSFYYQDNLDLLEAWGAELAVFSPLEDASLPQDISGIYIGGGFPELYSAELAANKAIKKDIKKAAEQGIPLYAECGGYMYLGNSMEDIEGNKHEMVGAIPISSQIKGSRLNLGYRIIEAIEDGPLLGKGESVRGHEFHWSVLKDGSENGNAYRIIDQDNRIEGFQQNNLLASYIHLHMGSKPGMAARFIENCKRYKDKKSK